MDSFYSKYAGHSRSARKAVVELGLVKENDLPYMTDDEVAKLINESSYIVIDNGEDWILIPKEIKDKITWICR